jgi:Arc/MetJ-type ribon-helix-helix transcriptional regulator
MWFEMPKRKIGVKSMPVGTRVTKRVLEQIENLVKEGYYMDVSDYLRDIIRKDLQERKLTTDTT